MRVKYLVVSIATLLVVSIFSLTSNFSLLTTVLAQSCPTGSTPIRVTDGTTSFLSSGGDLSIFSTEGKCATGARATIPSFGIPSYDDIKSVYYSQSKSSTTVEKHTVLTGDKTQDDITLNGSKDHIYNVSGNLTLSGDINGNPLGVIFVDGNLNINSNITSPPPKSGVIFIVRGDISISPSVTQIDGVLMNYGNFCSAGTASSCPSSVDAPQLVINGSVLFLNSISGASPRFVRNLSSSGNSDAAEKINYTPKYLVLLKNILGRDLVVWNEN